jgi:hypothetical protein
MPAVRLGGRVDEAGQLVGEFGARLIAALLGQSRV